MDAPERERRIRIVVFDINPNSGAIREDSYTLAVAPTWARIHLRHPVAPGATLVVYNPETGRQAEFFVDSTPAPQEVKISLADRAVDIWQLREAKREPAAQIGEEGRQAPGEGEWQQIETALRAEVQSAAAEPARGGVDGAGAAEAAAAARRAEAEVELRRADEYARLLEAQIAEQTETTLAAHRQALKITLNTAQVLQKEVEEISKRAEQARERAVTFSREANDACARAAASAGDLEALLSDKKEADHKLAEARRQLQQAEEALAAARAEVARIAGLARAKAEAAARAAESLPRAPIPPKPEKPPAAPIPPIPVGPEPSISQTGRFVAGFTGPISWDDRRSCRRVQVKTRARIRRTHLSEVVQPINVSRKGLGFESSTPYEMDSKVWVALHYREGAVDVLETPSRIVRIIPRGDGQTYYGVRFEG